ncbi:hypothetical protein BIY24_06435 [Halobacteriovorax marinus]|uniref:Membrane protein n=1 Tax=Halobacteriovorax marinus (strain ATCC BAA-682 / DSM 15412 / SJ) TaxID=862908 RepID=E1WZP0_HALMS|nr:hypothetical protein [Halobacteriovorax marinus]ATH07595.1 hypothetical protein BIY24_06435 [Halobacteriovorax marinus]CBW26226.1 putative membrane protein [Halobacteriovorax marinus SJ]
MNFQIIRTLTENTINKEFRSKAITFIFIFTFIVITLIKILLDFINTNFNISGGSIGGEGFFIIFLGLSSISSITSILLGLNCVSSDFASSSISQILSFPIRRVEYLISRILGAWIISLVLFIISIIYSIVLFSLYTPGTLEFGGLFVAIISMSANMLTLATLAALSSLYMPKMYAFIFLFIFRVFLSSVNTSFMSSGGQELFANLSIFKVIRLIFYFFFPRVQIMDSYAKSFLGGSDIGVNFFTFYAHYGVTYILLFALLAFIFSRRDI